MIKMNSYKKEFENEYYEIVDKRIIKSNKDKIINSCKKYFPDDRFKFIDNEDNFKELILLPFDKIKEAYKYMTTTHRHIMQAEFFNKDGTFKSYYKELHDTYSLIRDSKKKKVKLNVRIVKESKLLTCPYCNRDYINSRGDDAAGAQLDHFYCRSKFPVFSLCLYNLIPTCGNCNHIKGDNDNEMVSPFDNEVNFIEDLKFSYELNENGIELIINANGALENNISILKLKEAYLIHDEDVIELIDKAKTYCKTQKEEIIAMFEEKHIDLTDIEIKKLIFGRNIGPNYFGRKPLSKLTYDILKELKIEI